MITLYYRGCEITFPNIEECEKFCIHNAIADLICAYEEAWEALANVQG